MRPPSTPKFMSKAQEVVRLRALLRARGIFFADATGAAHKRGAPDMFVANGSEVMALWVSSSKPRSDVPTAAQQAFAAAFAPGVRVVMVQGADEALAAVLPRPLKVEAAPRLKRVYM